MAEHKEKEEKAEQHNRISVADFVVESSTESLDKLEQTMDSLIKKHKKFVTLRRTKKRFEHMAG